VFTIEIQWFREVFENVFEWKVIESESQNQKTETPEPKGVLGIHEESREKIFNFQAKRGIGNIF
jgi:hypothetical protein